jgi:hypothetical protein
MSSGYSRPQMSTFIEDVRSRRVHPPTNQKFDPSVWSAAKGDKTTDDRDRQFAEAGLFFFSQLEEVRTRLPNTLSPFARSPMESLRLIIGFQNLDFRKMQIGRTHFCYNQEAQHTLRAECQPKSKIPCRAPFP